MPQNPNTMRRKPGGIRSVLHLFVIFLRLGLTSFGGPVAHFGYFRAEFVDKRKWFTVHSYTDIIALCQLLPGPASSQLAIAIGLSRARYIGAIVAWFGFTMPSAILLVLFAYGLNIFGDVSAGWIQGLKIVAVAVVAQAVWIMWNVLCPTRLHSTFSIIGALIVLFYPTALGQVLAIIGGGVLGCIFLKNHVKLPHEAIPVHISKIVATVALIIFCGLLFLLPIFTQLTDNQAFYLFESFFRTGSLVFGGGHVVLPLLQSVVVPTGMVSNSVFLAGYGAAQAIPGPLFSFSAFLGAISNIQPNGVNGAAICLFSIYLPSFLLIIGLFPFWENLRKYEIMKGAMTGVNTSVVGLVLAALYSPVWTSTVHTITDFSMVLAAYLLLSFWKMTPWLVVILGALVGHFLI